jgi:hypothetical protein
MPESRLRPEAYTLSALFVGLVCSLSSVQAKDCKATAKASTFEYKSGELAPQFAVRVQGCGARQYSTGRVLYSARIVDDQNREDTLTSLDARWIRRQGSQFTFGPSGTERLPAGRVARVRELTDVEVSECECVD